MRVLWICNIMLPAVAEHLGLEASNKEGWLTGLSNMILRHQKENGIELGVCFPADENLAAFEQVLKVREEGVPSLRSDESAGEKDGMTGRIHAFGFYEDVHRAEVYDERTEERLREIVNKFQPDIVHCFGTEYPHTLAMTRAFGKPERTLIGIQGLCSIYARHFRADLPDKVWRRITFRDRIKKDDLRRQHEKYVRRGAYEIEAIQRAGHITGRTEWDRKYTQEWNPQAAYHFMNETLRPDFYEGCWQAEKCRRYTVFLSQGDYPIKGLHYMLRAMPEILKRFPETEVYVAGNSIIKSADEKSVRGFMGKLKLESYGKYILQLMKETGTLSKVHFQGKLTAKQMKREYLNCNVFVCPSSIENSPNSVGEAMMLGVPAVCAEVGGIPDIFTDKVDGLLYPAGDTEKLAAAVIKMLEGGETVKRYTKAARAHARKTHDGDKNYRRLMEIYEEIAPLTQENV